MNLVDLVNDQYIKLKNDRYKDWFSSFLAHTNQKKLAAKALKKIIGGLLQNKSYCKILDIGAGEGSFAKNIVETLKVNCNVSYSGIEKLKNYVESASNILHGLNISLVNILEGDFTNQSDLQRLPNDTDIILVSHVAYYAENVTEFVFNLIDKADDNTIIFFVHQSIFSKASELRNRYGLSTVPASPQLELKRSLESKGLKVKELYYPAAITFPDDVSVRDVINAISSIRTSLPNIQEVRNLLEFIIHAPLEYLRARNELEYFVEIFEKILKDQNNYFITWDAFQIATKYELQNLEMLSEPMYEQNVKDLVPSTLKNNLIASGEAIRLKDLPQINLLTLKPLELACYTGNVDIVKQLKSQITQASSFIGLNLASRNGHIEIVQELLEIKELFDLNIKSEEGLTALHLATYFDHPYITSLLIYAGANIHEKDNYGQTALDLSARNCNIGSTEILLNHINSEELGSEKIHSLVSILSQECKGRAAELESTALWEKLSFIIAQHSDMKSENSNMIGDANHEFQDEL